MIRQVKAPLRIDLAGGWTDVPIYTKRYIGAVLSAAINISVNGSITSGEKCSTSMLTCNAPKGSGLGMSGAMAVAFLALTGRQIKSRNNRLDLAEDAFKLEQLQGIVGGKQDQYAAALGGVNYFTFEEHDTDVKSYRSDSRTLTDLEDRLVLCYSGKSRMSSEIHEAVWDSFKRNDGDTREALCELREYAAYADGQLRAGALDLFAETMDLTWFAMKRLHPMLTNETVEGIYAAAKNAGAKAGKACGAGGGGCLVFYCEPDALKSVEQAITDAGATVLNFMFDYEGVRISET